MAFSFSVAFCCCCGFLPTFVPNFVGVLCTILKRVKLVWFALGAVLALRGFSLLELSNVEFPVI